MSNPTPEDAPPPYTVTDPLTSPYPINCAATAIYSPRPAAPVNAISYNSLVGPVNFISAASYFHERPPPVVQPGEEILEHTLTIYARSESRDYSHSPRCWSSRSGEITELDWNTFLNYVFPPHLAPAARQSHLPPKLRAEIEREGKDRPQETDEQRQARITAVITEWNEHFFGPRATRILYS